MRYLVSILLLAFSVGASTRTAAAQEPNFGRAMVLSGSDLAIGQPVNWYGPGTVYVYRQNDAGEWQAPSRLTASDASRKDDFGAALAMEGNTLIVGAPRKHDGSGVAYAFERDDAGSEWRQVSIIEPPAGGNHAEYATALALSGDDLFLGSPATDSTGVVYHLRRSGDSWSVEGVLRSEQADAGAEFGRTLSLDGDWLLVGAPAADSAVGQLFFYQREADEGWAEAQVINPPSAVAGAGAGVGSAVLLNGDRAFVGVPGEAAVFVLGRDAGGGWSPAGQLRPFDGDRSTRFGYSIALAGDEVWVGAPGINRFNGRVYRFLPHSDGGWGSAVRFDAEGADGTSWPFAFGLAMAATDDEVVVGMPMRDFGEGRALVVRKDDGGEWEAARTLEGEIYRIGESLTPGARCTEGQLGEFPCQNMELVSHMPISELGGERGVWVNDVWGWTDPQTGRDYALVARRDGTSFVDVTDPAQPRLVGNLPRTEGSPPSVWRDIKVSGDHAYVVSDGAAAHGMQVFDLARLRSVSGAPETFEPDATYREIHSAHNVVADTASRFLYIVGANGGGETCGGGLHMVDAREPKSPVFAGCYHDTSGASSRGYTHDAQCLVYDGPDEEYRGRQICVGSNEKEINIADVTDKENPSTIGRGSYPNAAYTHQGWFDDEQRYFYQNDELDELAGTVEGTRTIVWDLAELDDPVVVREYIGPVMASDHNLFVKGDLIYEANYGSGLRVLDISDRENPREIAFFDSAPLNDDGPGHSSGQSGAWSNYPFFEGDYVVFTSVREGLFIMRVAEPIPTS